jgi:3',5'-nucleoside bisphosphate phosphatase
LRVDLHLHTSVSDGELPAAEVVRLAARAGVGVIAITDHDTAGGVPEAVLAAHDLPVIVMPGIEISSRWEGVEHHILGYWIDPLSDAIRHHQEHALLRRSRRMESMLELLREMGIDLAFSDVQAAAGPDVRALGRPHLARALFAAGYTRYYGEAFTRLIGDGGPAFVAEGFPTPAQAVDTIHAAGGVAVWAHPPLEIVSEELPAMARLGIDGVECFRPNVSPQDAAALERAGRALGLFPTGGSDWHGPHRAELGDFRLDAIWVEEVLAYGGIRI